MGRGSPRQTEANADESPGTSIFDQTSLILLSPSEFDTEISPDAVVCDGVGIP